jgi:hypothetical protein
MRGVDIPACQPLVKTPAQRQKPAMADPQTLTGLAHNIQLSVAPVFLLTGIGSLLNVFVHRLSRVVDRVRFIEAQIDNDTPEARIADIVELTALDRRLSVVHGAIGLCSMSALLICIVVALLFVGEPLVRFASVVSALFIVAMLLLIGGLLLFLIEVQLSRRLVRVKSALLKER